MKRVIAVSFLVMMVLFSCRSGGQSRSTQAAQKPVSTGPSTVAVPEPAPVEPAPAAPVETPVFDPSTISQEEKNTAKTAIQDLIRRLNGIIRAKNYNAWVSYLDNAYFAAISSKEYLDRTSKSAVLVKQGITLRSAQDYFNHVVVPSRTNDRVDDIEYVSPNRVKAYTFNTKGERLRLYDLEKSGNEWKIIN